MRPLRTAWAAFACLTLLSSACHEIHFETHTEPGVIGIYDDLYAVSAPGGGKVVATGYWGAIYHSEDGGSSWAKGESGTKSLVYNVSMADAQRGWAVGQRGMILRTEDGGHTWAEQANVKQEQGAHLFGVHAIDANTAWAVGEWGTRMFTDDGGLSWQDRSLTIDEFHPQFVWLAPVDQERVRRGEKVYEDVGLNDVYCLPRPSQSCWIAGEFGYIYSSRNLGSTWEPAEIAGDVHLDPIVLGYNQIRLDEAHVEAIKSFAAGIVDEEHLNILVEPVASAREIREFGREEDPSELFDILAARTQEVVAVVEDSGILSDRIRKVGSPPWDFEDFLEDDPDFLRRYLKGRLAERSGVVVNVSQNPFLFTIRFDDEQTGFIAGLGGVILRSSDGGRTWEYRETDRKHAIFSLSPLNGQLIAVGEKGLVRVSRDGGETWLAPETGFPTIFTFMRDINHAPGRQVAFIVGQQGLVLRTSDGGATWDQVLPPESDDGVPGHS
jgi:photosystem II stability/assembly factor-like uncharacterized protein